MNGTRLEIGIPLALDLGLELAVASLDLTWRCVALRGQIFAGSRVAARGLTHTLRASASRVPG